MSDPQEGYERLFLDIQIEALPELFDAVAATYGYRAEIPDTTPEGRRQRATIPNPQTKAAFAREHIKQHLTQIVANYRKQQAARSVSTDTPNLF